MVADDLAMEAAATILAKLFWFILILAWIMNYIHYKVWDEITFPS